MGAHEGPSYLSSVSASLESLTGLYNCDVIKPFSSLSCCSCEYFITVTGMNLGQDTARVCNRNDSNICGFE